MDFGRVVKPLGITVKKEGGKVETSNIVRSLVTRDMGRAPRRGPKNVFEKFF